MFPFGLKTVEITQLKKQQNKTVIYKLDTECEPGDIYMNKKKISFFSSFFSLTDDAYQFSV